MQPENDSFQGDLLLFVVAHVGTLLSPTLPLFCRFILLLCSAPFADGNGSFAFCFRAVRSVSPHEGRETRDVSLSARLPVFLHSVLHACLRVPHLRCCFFFVLFLPCWSCLRVADREECTLPCCVALFRLVFLIYVCSWDWFAGVPRCAIFSSPRGARRDGSLPSLCKQVTSILTATGRFLSRSSAR